MTSAIAKISRRGSLDARRLLNANRVNFSLTSPFSETETNLKSLCDCENSNPQLKNAVSVFQQALDSGDSLAFPGNNLMATLVRSRNHKLAFSVYRKMLETNTFINFVSLSGLPECFLQLHHTNGFAGLCKNLEYGKAVSLLRDMRLNSPTPDAISYNTVIRGLCEGKELEKEWELANEMQGSECSWSLRTCGILIDAFCKAGKMEEAMGLV